MKKQKPPSISEVDSKTHLPLQFMDVILGAICFKLNEKDKLKADGDERPGKRTILKLKLYKSNTFFPYYKTLTRKIAKKFVNHHSNSVIVTKLGA